MDAFYKRATSKAQILLYAFSILILIIVVSLIVLDSGKKDEAVIPPVNGYTETLVQEEISWVRVPFNNYRMISMGDIEGDGALLQGRGVIDMGLEPGTYNLSYWISICPDFALEYTRTYRDQSLAYNPLRERIVVQDGVLVKERKSLREYFSSLVEERVYVLEVLDGEDVLFSKPLAEQGSGIFSAPGESVVRFAFRSRCPEASVLLRLYKQE